MREYAQVLANYRPKKLVETPTTSATVLMTASRRELQFDKQPRPIDALPVGSAEKAVELHNTLFRPASHLLFKAVEAWLSNKHPLSMQSHCIRE